MMQYLVQSALILTLFFAVYRMIFVRFTFFQHNRFFLLSGLGFSLLLPFLPLNFSAERTEYVYLPKNYFENISAETSSEVQSGSFWQGWTTADWVLAVYFAGLIVFSLIMLFQIIQIILFLRKGKRMYKDGMNLVLTNKNTSPFSFFNTIVLNPEMLSEEQLGHIITHENIHISQWHQLDVVLAEILKTVLWFFPVSWWYGKAVRTNLEFIADTSSLKNGLDKKAYQLNLVSISQQPSGSVLVNNFSKKLIKNRIKMLNKMKTKKHIASFYVVLIPVLVLVSVGISVQAQSRNEKVKQVIVLSDEKIEPENIKGQIKNEKDEFEELDSTKITLHPAKEFEDNGMIILDATGNRLRILDTGKPGKLSWEDLFKINPSEIASMNVDKSGDKTSIIIRYKDGRKNDTIVKPENIAYGYSFSADEMRIHNKEDGQDATILRPEKIVKDGGTILSPKELKEKIQKGEFDLNKPENGWMKKWKQDNFKEPIDYSSYHKLLDNWDSGVYKKDKGIKILPQFIPDYYLKAPGFNSPHLEYQSSTLKNGVGIKTDGNKVIVSSDGMDVQPKEGQGSTIIASTPSDGNTIVINGKKQLQNLSYFIGSKKVSKKEFDKIINNDEYKISYIISDDPKMIKKYGKGIATDGIGLATKKGEKQEKEKKEDNQIYSVPETSFQNGKNPKIYIDGKRSNLSELNKIEKNNTRKIQYMVSDGKEEIEKYGPSVAKDLGFRQPKNRNAEMINLKF